MAFTTGESNANAAFRDMVLDGKLSWEEFVRSCDYFLNVAEHLHEEWVCKGDRKSPGDYYLSYSCFRTFPDKMQSVFVASDASEKDALETHNSTVVNCQYDIVYSLSYGVPVLYFNMSRFDGQLLSLDEIWNLFTNSDRSNSEQLWSTLTQQDHPLLNIPFYTIHPCNTEKIMSEIQNNSSVAIENYLISWLSIVGSKTGIYLCNDFGKYIAGIQK